MQPLIDGMLFLHAAIMDETADSSLTSQARTATLTPSKLGLRIKSMASSLFAPDRDKRIKGLPFLSALHQAMLLTRPPDRISVEWVAGFEDGTTFSEYQPGFPGWSDTDTRIIAWSIICTTIFSISAHFATQGTPAPAERPGTRSPVEKL